MDVDRNGLEVLFPGECRRLLATGTIGRIGMSSDALPTVLPVNYHFDGERIVVITSAGSKLDAALRNAVVAFEVDDFDPIDHTGWSVVVIGIARVVCDGDDLARIHTLPVTRWAPRGAWHAMTIDVDWISGRRIPRGSGRSVEWDPPFDLRSAALARTERDAAS
jgi:uncharacterized protein